MLLGRESECEAIDALLRAARESRSGALVLRGEAGIGKTALLQYAAEHANGMRVLSGSGVETESELPFAGLHQLLWTALDHAQQRLIVGHRGEQAEHRDRHEEAVLDAVGREPERAA